MAIHKSLREGTFAYGWLTQLDTPDIEGRPLSEGGARLSFGCDFEYAVCPYKDFRFGSAKLMNRSGLLSITRHWSAIEEWVKRIVKAYDLRYANADKSVLDVWRIAGILRVAPFFAMGTHLANIEGTARAVSMDMAGAYKAARGVSDAILHMACGGTDVALMPLASVYEFACKRRLLEGASEVCAGSPSLIRSFIEMIAATPSSCPYKTGDESMDWTNRLLEYSATSLHVETISMLYDLVRFRVDFVNRRYLENIGRSVPVALAEKYPLSKFSKSFSSVEDLSSDRRLQEFLKLSWPQFRKSSYSSLIFEIFQPLGHLLSMGPSNFDCYSLTLFSLLEDYICRIEERLCELAGCSRIERSIQQDLNIMLGPPPTPLNIAF